MHRCGSCNKHWRDSQVGKEAASAGRGPAHSTFKTYWENPKPAKSSFKNKKRSSSVELPLGDDVNRLKQRLEAQGEVDAAASLGKYQAASKAARLSEKSPEDQSIVLNRELLRRKELKVKHEAALAAAVEKQKEILEEIETSKALIAKDEVEIANLVAKAAAIGTGCSAGGSVIGAAEVLRGLTEQLSQSAKETPEYQALGCQLAQLLSVFQKLIDVDRESLATKSAAPAGPAAKADIKVRDPASLLRIDELKKAFVQGLAAEGVSLVSDEEASLDAIIVDADMAQERRGRSRSRERTAREPNARRGPIPKASSPLTPPSPQSPVLQGGVEAGKPGPSCP